MMIRECPTLRFEDRERYLNMTMGRFGTDHPNVTDHPKVMADRWVKVVVAAVVVIAVVITSAGAASAAARTAVPPTGPPEGPGSAVPEAPTGDWAEPPVRAPDRRLGAWLAKPLTPLAVRARPAGRRVSIARPQTPTSGQAHRLLVLEQRTIEGQVWLRVRLPVRPNDASGWVPRDRVVLERTPLAIVVRLRAREVRVLRAGRVVRRARAVIGSPRTPTPLGLFAVQEAVRQRDPRAFLGTWAVHLTAHSEVLDSFDGGPARVAIHGRAGVSLRDPLGSARSNGCIRVDNSVVDWIARSVPSGTPVWVVR